MTEINHKPCPYTDCGSTDAFSYNTEKMVGSCFSCGRPYPSKADKFKWARDKYPTKQGDHKLAVVENYHRYGDEGQSYRKIPASGNNEYLDYREHRGISEATMKFYNVLTTVSDGEEVGHTYIYPDGGKKTRIFPKMFKADGLRTDTLFGMDKFNAGSAQAVSVTEGEVDCMSAYQMLGSKYPVVSLPSATPHKNLLANCKDWLGSFEKIYLSLDSDNKADKFALQLMRLFPGRVYRVPHDKFKDANEFLQAGATEQYKRSWWNARLFVPDNILASSEDFLNLYSDTPEHIYVPTGIKSLDEKILGLMQGQFTVLLAETGIGKTELMRALEWNLIQNHPDVKFASWHLEETKLRSLLGLVSYDLRDNVTRKDLIEQKGRSEVVKKSIEKIGNSNYMQFSLDESSGADELIDQIRILTQVYGCQYIFFEPIQDVISIGNDESKEAALATLSVQLSKMAADLNIGIVTIAHTNDNGDPKYCKMISQRAGVRVVLKRDKESTDMVERNTLRMFVTKNRPCGIEGDAGSMVFNLDTFMLEEPDKW